MDAVGIEIDLHAQLSHGHSTHDDVTLRSDTGHVAIELICVCGVTEFSEHNVFQFNTSVDSGISVKIFHGKRCC